MTRVRHSGIATGLIALLIGLGSMAWGLADPVDPRIVVRGTSVSGTYHIEDLTPFTITLDQATVLGLNGTFDTGSDPNSALDNAFGLIFQNLTGQTITRIVIQFAIDDFYSGSHVDPYAPSDTLIYEGEGRNGFTFLGDPFAEVSNGVVTWTFTGTVPSGTLDKDTNLFFVNFFYFPQGTTAHITVSTPEPGTVLLLLVGLALFGISAGRFRVLRPQTR